MKPENQENIFSSKNCFKASMEDMPMNRKHTVCLISNNIMNMEYIEKHFNRTTVDFSGKRNDILSRLTEKSIELKLRQGYHFDVELVFNFIMAMNKADMIVLKDNITLFHRADCFMIFMFNENSIVVAPKTGE